MAAVVREYASALFELIILCGFLATLVIVAAMIGGAA
jgi:hypothetical protein